jgi:beta-lactam-binding protein with PASTA domain
MKDVFIFLRSKVFLLNIILALLVAAGVFGFTYQWLDKYTNHGQSIEVPELKGLNMEQVKVLLERLHLRYAVVDSMYQLEKKPGIILEQDPVPKAKVKEDRTIYLTINSGIAPRVKMPDLTDVSLRQAEAILETFGLKSGGLTYRHDLAKNAVLETRYRGRPIKPGTSVNKGSVIDLVVGDGIGSERTSVPDLTGLTWQEAMTALNNANLAAGAVIFDENIKDSMSAVVYKQFPLPSDSFQLKQGESVDIYLGK